MTRWDALTTVCGYLRAGLLGGTREPVSDIHWELMVEVASFHYVTPALAWCLRADPGVPPDVREYFDAMAALNDQRNDKMLAGLARVAGLLNAIDVEPVLLKGASLLAEDIYREPSARFLSDIDILIPADRAVDVVAALRTAGFDTKPTDVVPPPSHHHLPMLHDPETGAGVELHTDVVSRAPDAVIATAWFCEWTRPAPFRNQRIRLPEPTRNAGHVIFHSEVFHGLYWRNKIQLRHLLDLALIRARHEGAIDWDELDHRFAAASYGEVLATYLAFAEALFGQKTPRLSHAPRPDAMVELRQTESRDNFRAQIEHLKLHGDILQSELSRMTEARDRFQSETERLNANFADAAAAREQLQSEAEHLDAEIVRIASAREAAVVELDGAMRAKAELERDLARMRASRSWRVTRPMRALMAASRRWLNLAQ